MQLTGADIKSFFPKLSASLFSFFSTNTTRRRRKQIMCTKKVMERDTRSILWWCRLSWDLGITPVHRHGALDITDFFGVAWRVWPCSTLISPRSPDSKVTQLVTTTNIYTFNTTINKPTKLNTGESQHYRGGWPAFSTLSLVHPTNRPKQSLLNSKLGCWTERGVNRVEFHLVPQRQQI